MDTEALRLFVRAADRLNISAAGRDLGLAPAVASAKLAKLEAGLGVELLHRTTRKVSLSLEGADFLPFAREILAQEDAARAAIGTGGAQAAGTLRFAAPSSFAQQYIIPLLPEFLETYPGLTLDLRLSDSPFDAIEGSFDLALRNSPLQDSSLKGRKLAEDRRVLCAAPSYLDVYGRPETPEELAEHRLIAFRDAGPRTLVHKDGAEASFHPAKSKGRVLIDDGLSQKLLTIQGAGISINSLWSVHDALCSGALVRVLPDYTLDDQAKLWLVYPSTNVLSPKVRIFMDFLIAKIGRHPVWMG
ncbi:LysR family transcriptional regulator [Roseovarius sp. C7]|uniref:LysR family transcriptional regulator n=1 Tax=Roseovarius sp. C7 TaxID=3398643 RepID=UPI0039F70BF5